MLLPVLDIKLTAYELARLCRLLNELKNICDDSNLCWKIAQLLGKAEELNEQFLDQFNLWHVSYNDGELFEKLFNDDKIEALLSFAFNSAAVLDSAIYKEFAPAPDFTNSVKFIRKGALSLLHDRRGLS